jgi:hypothetical protein
MEFRLVYRGRLPAASQSEKRSREKHEVRKALHPQLKTLWQTHQRLRFPNVNHHMLEGHLLRHEFGYRSLPLVSDYFNCVCELDILFLRRDEPGNLLRSGGDLDNRLKVLLDGLRRAQSLDEVGSSPPTADEDPFYTLLEDDRLVIALKVTTDRLLTPMQSGESQNDVELVIHVKTIPLNTPTL